MADGQRRELKEENVEGEDDGNLLANILGASIGGVCLVFVLLELLLFLMKVLNLN